MISAWRCNLDGEKTTITPVNLQTVPAFLDDASQQLPAGAYTTLRTYDHSKAIRLKDHFERLKESAKQKGYDLTVDEFGIRKAIRLALDQGDTSHEYRVRITLDLSQQLGSVYLTAEVLRIPPVIAYEQGVPVVTCGLHRDQPGAKLTDFIHPASQYRKVLPPGVEEALMVNPAGEILEGLSSNFFGILSTRLITAGEAVLAGITRSLAIDAARQLSLPIEYRAVQMAEIPSIDEAFITSASRGILPVRKIDNSLIGDGHPGEVTRRLAAAFDRLVEQEQEMI